MNAMGLASDTATARSRDVHNGAKQSSNSLNAKRKEHIKHVLDLAGNDLAKAAEMLDITTGQLRWWMRRLDIHEEECSPE